MDQSYPVGPSMGAPRLEEMRAARMASGGQELTNWWLTFVDISCAVHGYAVPGYAVHGYAVHGYAMHGMQCMVML